MGDQFSKVITGRSATEVQDFRTRAERLTATMLSTITGEESGRFTDTEREIATKVLAARDTWRSFPQIRKALAVAMELEVLSKDRALAQQGLTPAFDILSKDEKVRSQAIIGQARQLRDLGLNNAEVKKVVKSLIKQRRIRGQR